MSALGVFTYRCGMYCLSYSSCFDNLSVYDLYVGGDGAGIEPTNDCFRAIHAGLKSGAPTSDASVSVNGNMQKALINVQ